MLLASRGHGLPSTSILKLTDHAIIVRDTGGLGIPIILLHALSMDGGMYRAVYPSLSRNARVITYDIRGFGYAQDAPLVKDFAQLADDLGTLLDALSIEVADVKCSNPFTLFLLASEGIKSCPVEPADWLINEHIRP